MMPKRVPSWPKTAGASDADEYVLYGAWTGLATVTAVLAEVVTVDVPHQV
jgi:hypothetical protein